MAMGNWKTKTFSKKQRASRTRSSRAKIYFAIPPAEGWGEFKGNYAAFGLRRGSK